MYVFILKYFISMKNYFYIIFSFINWLLFSLKVIHAIREVGTSLIICDMLIYCSFCNYQFSENVLKLLMVKKCCFFNFLYSTHLNEFCSVIMLYFPDTIYKQYLGCFWIIFSINTWQLPPMNSSLSSPY